MSRQDIVFQYVENDVGVVLFALSLEKGLILHVVPLTPPNHHLKHLVPTNILLQRLCLRPPDPYTIGKLRFSTFFHVLLVLGGNMGSLLSKSCQFYGIFSKAPIFGKSQILQLRDNGYNYVFILGCGQTYN